MKVNNLLGKISKILNYTFLIIVSFISLFPFYWMLVSATNTSNDVAKGRMFFGTHFIENLTNALTNTNLGRASINSIFLVTVITILSLIVSSMAGYSFVMFESKARNIILGIMILSMMIPFAAVMIPLYSLFGSFNILDQFIAIILPNTATAFVIFFFRQNAKSFPKDLAEAARIDGLSELQIFFRVFFPTMKATYAAGAIIIFMNTWNNYMWPLIVLQSPSKQTIPVVIAALGDSVIPDYGMIMNSLFIATIPSAVIFFALQKYFVQGMVGSLKG